MKTYKLIGSAGSLEDLEKLIKDRWSWSHAIFKPTEIKNIFTVQSNPNHAGFIEGLRVVKKANRYRLETEQ